MKTQTTKRQQDLLRIIYGHIKNIGFPPSFEEMREGLGVSSNQSVINLLVRLEKAKLIKRNQTAARSIKILPAGYKLLDKPSLAVFLGETSAGAPIEAIEILGEWQAIPSAIEKLEKPENEIFLLRVNGDSMINAGIDDGDAVLVQNRDEFFSGEIVLAQIDGNSTIKRFMSEDKPPYVYLKPENSKYKNLLFTDETRLTGKVVSILKNGSWQPVK